MMYARGRLLMLGWLVSARAGLPGKRRTRREARVSTVKSRIPFGPSALLPSALHFALPQYLLFPLPYICSDCQSGKARILAAATGHPSRPNAGLRFIVPAHSPAPAPT
jgi:hypothetical protein